jgi:hypothetical protein
MRPPKLIKPYVVSFARQVIRLDNASPFYVRCSPVQGAIQNECFSVVEEYVAQHKGISVIGWAIWERPRVFIEAEFHAIWCAPNGDYVDISPREFPSSRILFVCDPRRKHNGLQVDNVRKALCKDKDVHRFLFLRSEYFRLSNKGDLKHQFGDIPVTPELLANVEEAIALEDKIDRRYGPWLPETIIAKPE